MTINWLYLTIKDTLIFDRIIKAIALVFVSLLIAGAMLVLVDGLMELDSSRLHNTTIHTVR